MRITFPTLDHADRTLGRLQRGEKVYFTRNEYYAGRIVRWRLLRGENPRYVSFDPVVVALDAELGPAVWLD